MTSSVKIPFLDLVTPHVELEEELVAFSAPRSGQPASSAARPWKDSSGSSRNSARRNYSIAVSSGTDALRFALMAAGVKQGDVVRHRSA